MTTNSDVTAGTLVRHNTKLDWGLGKVIHATHEHYFVYFKDIEGSPKDAVKTLKRNLNVLSLAEVQSDFVLDNLPPLVKNGMLALPNALRLARRLDQVYASRREPQNMIDS